MDKMRKPFQGVWNIIRFNWQFYVLAIATVVVLLLFRNNLTAALRAAAIVLAILIVTSTLISLTVSFYIYDISNLYKLTWLDKFLINNNKIVNINAGFDETSDLLKNKFANSELLVLDFYDPTKHTEVSIKRARKAYPPFPNTQQTSTTHLPFQDNTADKVFAILSAHEIRNDEERICFFKELKRVLTTTGKIVVTEHLQDTANFLAYNIGFFHFHSRTTWLNTFQSAGLNVADEIKVTPFITTFILDKNGTTS